MKRVYKEASRAETETTINVLYKEELIVVYSNNVSIEKQLYKILGKPKEEYIKGKSIIGSTWEVKFSDKTKIRNMMLKANIFEL